MPKKRKRLRGTVEKVIKSTRSPEKAQISIHEAEDLYREIRVENELDEDGAKARLKEGAEVRVTASQDGKGEWQASRVEILKVRQSHQRKRPQVRPAADRPTGLHSAL